MEYFKSPRAVSVELRRIKATKNAPSGRSPLEVSITYQNGTNVPITVISRSGIGFEIAPTPAIGAKDFTIRVTYAICKSVNIDVHRLLNMVDDDSSIEMRAIADALRHGKQVFDGRRTIFTIEYSVGRPELETRGGSLYLPQLDIVLSILQGPNVPTHPYNEQAQRRQLIESDPGINSSDTFGYYFLVIDNEGVYGDRFVNVCGEVFRVKAIKDYSRHSGIYLVSSGAVTGDFTNTPPRCIRYDFEEEKKVGLYRSYDEAKTLGDVFAEREREIKEMAQEYKREEFRLKAERLRSEEAFEEKKRQWETERLELEEERRRKTEEYKLKEAELAERAAKLKAEREELEHLRNIEAIRRKDWYEERSYGRKDYHEDRSYHRKDYHDERSHSRKEYLELLKYIPLVIAGIGAIVMAVKDLKKK